MKRTAFMLFICFITSAIYGQRKNIAGVYSLDGVMETAAAFKLSSDSTFEFYYSYGALDRLGSGTYRVEGNNIIFNSQPYPGRDFKMVDSSLTHDNFTTIKINDDNPAFYNFVACRYKTPAGDTLLYADEEGIIKLPSKTDTIVMWFELSGERISTFVINNKNYNSFTFRFEPWGMDKFFINFTLLYRNDHLEGNHPILEEGRYSYLKEK